MKPPLHHIGIQNFEAFRNFNLNPEGRHLLVYGSRNETVFRSTGIKDDNIRGFGCVPTNVVIEAHGGWPGAFQTGEVSESADQPDPEDSQASLL